MMIVKLNWTKKPKKRKERERKKIVKLIDISHWFYNIFSFSSSSAVSEKFSVLPLILVVVRRLWRWLPLFSAIQTDSRAFMNSFEWHLFLFTAAILTACAQCEIILFVVAAAVRINHLLLLLLLFFYQLLPCTIIRGCLPSPSPLFVLFLLRIKSHYGCIKVCWLFCAFDIFLSFFFSLRL